MAAAVAPMEVPLKAVQEPDYAVQFALGPLETVVRIGMRRLDRRQRCAHCGLRRVCFVVGVGDILASPPSCARCAGLRR